MITGNTVILVFLCTAIKPFTENPVSIMAKSVIFNVHKKCREMTLTILDLKGLSVHAMFQTSFQISPSDL